MAEVVKKTILGRRLGIKYSKIHAKKPYLFVYRQRCEVFQRLNVIREIGPESIGEKNHQFF